MAPMREWDHYARLPYQGRAHKSAHVDRIATVAALFGLPAAPIGDARVLELGCADGTNLLNMAAYLPGSEFVGIDAFDGHITDGKVAIQALGLHNITLHCRDIRDPHPDLGQFDYIVAHGVYSWVNAETRAALMEQIRTHLRPDGFALVSYNTEPGWSMYRPIRALMLWHTRALSRAAEEVGQSRAIVKLIREAMPSAEMPRARFLDTVLAELDAASDDYIYHEYLEPENHPVWFHQFAQHADHSGLQYVGESAFQAMLADNFPEAVQKTLHTIGTNLLDFEQYRDFLCDRRFRSSILTHRDRDITRTVSLQPLLNMAISMPLKPPTADGDGIVLAHRTHPDLTVHVTQPMHRHAVTLLSNRYPEAIPFPDIAAHCSDAIGRPADAALQTELAMLFMKLFRKNAAELYTAPPPVTATVAEHPVAPPLVRWLASQERIICSPRHEMFRLNPLETAVTTLLDGTRDQGALAKAIAPMLTTQNAPELATLSATQIAEQIVSQTLTRLAKDGLLTTAHTRHRP